jgi:hypothetical protein
MVSLFVASCGSQGYDGGILTLPQPGGPGPLIYIPQEQDGPVKSRSQKPKSKVKVKSQCHITNDGHSISMSWYLAALEGFFIAVFSRRHGTFFLAEP